MIAVDTSALMAILLDEPLARPCQASLIGHAELLISAATLIEARIVASRTRLVAPMASLLDDLDLRVVGIGPEDTDRIARIYRRWGKGFHPARLNFGDCFSYDVAKENACPLLYVGHDFWQTDIASALADPRTAPLMPGRARAHRPRGVPGPAVNPPPFPASSRKRDPVRTRLVEWLPQTGPRKDGSHTFALRFLPQRIHPAPGVTWVRPTTREFRCAPPSSP